MLDACKYQGFDPMMIFCNFIWCNQVALRARREIYELQYRTDGRGVTWQYSSHENLTDDVFLLVITFLNRGAMVSKLLKESRFNFARVIKMPCTKYDIEGRSRAEALDPERDKPTPLDLIWTYYLASLNSTVIPEEQRQSMCQHIGVIQDGAFIPAIVDKRDFCLGCIRELRSHERINDFFAEMASIQ
ncbi:hypothetical protein ANTPLA_LOCUS8968 [Anthophora plagiata]